MLCCCCCYCCFTVVVLGGYGTLLLTQAEGEGSDVVGAAEGNKCGAKETRRSQAEPR